MVDCLLPGRTRNPSLHCKIRKFCKRKLEKHEETRIFLRSNSEAADRVQRAAANAALANGATVLFANDILVDTNNCG